MQVAVEKLAGSRVSLQIEADPERVAQAYDNAFKEIRRTVPMPGFRKGKAPVQWIRRVVGGEAIDEAARDLLVEETLKEAIEQEGLTPLGQSEFDYEELQEGEVFKYTATFCVRPKFELPDYKGLSVEMARTDVTDELIDEEIQGRRERLATYTPVDRPVQAGDYVDLDYVAYSPTQTSPLGARRHLMSLCVGERWARPAIDDDVVGLQVGDSRTVFARLPDDHEEMELAGEAVCLDLVIRRVRERTVPEIDDEFAMRAMGVESLDEMRDELRGMIREEMEKLHRESAEDRLVARLIALCGFEIPEPLVQVECHRRVALWEADLERRHMKPNELLALTGETRDGLMHQARPAARYSVKRRLVLDAVASAEDIEASDEEVSDELADVAGEGLTVEVVRRQFEEAGALGEITEQIRQRKASAALLRAATVVEVAELSEEEKKWLEPDIEPDIEPEPEEDASPESEDNLSPASASTEMDAPASEPVESADSADEPPAAGESP